MENLEKIVCEISIKNKTSKKGNEFLAVVATLPNGNDVVISFDTKLYFMLRKYNNGKE